MFFISEDFGESQLKIGMDLSEVTKPGSYVYIRLRLDNVLKIRQEI